MKIYVNKKELVRCLSALSSITKTGNGLPILSMVLWEIKKGKITLTGTDLNSGIIFEMEGKVSNDKEEVGFLISLGILLEYVTTLEEGEILISIIENSVRILQKGSKSSLPISKTTDFPKINRGESRNFFEISINELLLAVKRVGIAVAVDGTRPVLTGILLRKVGGVMVLVGTDGYRLGLENICRQEGEDFDILISLKSINNILRALESGRVCFEIDKKNKQLWISQKNCIGFVRLIEGSFPDFNKIIPKNFSSKIEFEKDIIQMAINQTAVFARQNANIVKMDISDKVRFLTQSGYSGTSEVEIDAKKEGEKCLIAFNYRYLKEILGVFEDGNVVFEINGPLAPVKITSKVAPEFFHIIMPVKL